MINIQVREDIQRYFGGRGALRKHRTGFFNDLSNPQRMGLFFCIQNKAELDEIRELLSSLAKVMHEVLAVVFYQGTGSPDVITNKSIFMFSLDDFTLFARKKAELKQWFDRERFDLLISFVFEPEPFCRVLLSELHADFKIGPAREGDDELYDLMIVNEQEWITLSQYYNEVIHSLRMLNLKNN